MESTKTDMSIEDISESKLWDISDFKDFRLCLLNHKSKVDSTPNGVNSKVYEKSKTHSDTVKNY